MEVFESTLRWSGAGSGPGMDPNTYSRNLEVSLGRAGDLAMSAAPGFKGDGSRANPEQLLVAALSACQALTYLFLAARAGLVVRSYTDQADGRLGLVEGRTRMHRVTLRPVITLDPDADETTATALVEQAHGQCFIANSVTTRVEIEPRFERAV